MWRRLFYFPTKKQTARSIIFRAFEKRKIQVKVPKLSLHDVSSKIVSGFFVRNTGGVKRNGIASQKKFISRTVLSDFF